MVEPQHVCASRDGESQWTPIPLGRNTPSRVRLGSPLHMQLAVPHIADGPAVRRDGRHHGLPANGYTCRDTRPRRHPTPERLPGRRPPPRNQRRGSARVTHLLSGTRLHVQPEGQWQPDEVLLTRSPRRRRAGRREAPELEGHAGLRRSRAAARPLPAAPKSGSRLCR